MLGGARRCSFVCVHGFRLCLGEDPVPLTFPPPPLVPQGAAGEDPAGDHGAD